MNKTVFKALTSKETECQNVEECIQMFNHTETKIIEQQFKEQLIPTMANTQTNISTIKILIRYFHLIGQTFLILMMFNVKFDKFAN